MIKRSRPGEGDKAILDQGPAGAQERDRAEREGHGGVGERIEQGSMS